MDFLKKIFFLKEDRKRIDDLEMRLKNLNHTIDQMLDI